MISQIVFVMSRIIPHETSLLTYNNIVINYRADGAGDNEKDTLYHGGY
jgi:hypothetical protein